MDELIILIVRAIARALSGDKQPPRRSPGTPLNAPPPPAQPMVNLPPQWQEQVRRIAREQQRLAANSRPTGKKKGKPQPQKQVFVQTAAPVEVRPEVVELPATKVTAIEAVAPIANEIRIALSNQKELRRQFVLNEILQPPVALRQ